MGSTIDGVDFEAAITISRKLVRTGSEAIAALCDPQKPRFWRNSAEPDRSKDLEERTEYRFPTVSLACSIALLQAARLSPDLLTSPAIRAAVDAAREIPHDLELSDLEASTLSGGDQISSFTTAQYLQAAAELGDTSSPDQIEHLEHNLKKLSDRGPSPLELDEEVVPHPFVLYHLLKAANAWEEAFGTTAELSHIRQEATIHFESAARQILANHFLAQASPDEYVALAFCGCGLVMGSSEHDPIALSALEVSAAAQDSAGCWALGRVVDDLTDRDKIEISTYEIAWSMSVATRTLLQRDKSTSSSDKLVRVIHAVIAAAEYAAKNTVTVDDNGKPLSGWCGDHAFGRPLVESWTSGTVLHAGLELQRLLASYQSKRTLENFIHASPTDDNWPAWLRWESFQVQGEVDTNARILNYLDEAIVKPILSSSAKLPDPQEGTVSVVLFGPPGTSKTTIAKGVADGLGWPLVQLSPGVFIERGLELIEAQASSVFSDLHRLERAVVLFDECDELFRERSPDGATEQVRSITAFVTASMLPKLQDLHDLGRVVFFICTNNFHALDSAVKRRGRIDHIVGVGPPDEGSRRLIVRSTLGAEMPPEAPGVARLIIGTDRFTRGELIYVAKQFAAQRQGSSQDDELAQSLIDGFQPSLNISVAAMEAFTKQAAESSAPHITKRS